MHDLMSGFEFILRGGFMMYPLLLSALIALTVIIERGRVFQTRFKADPQFAAGVLELARAGKIEQAEKKCEAAATPIAGVLAAGLSHFENPIEEMELAMKNEAEQWVPKLEKRIDVIDTVITAAPLMGLLGTITGMMASFRVLSEKGVNEPNAITGGVAEALIATATGLVVALVCLVAYNYFSAKVKLVIYDLESVASRLAEVRMAVHREKK